MNFYKFTSKFKGNIASHKVTAINIRDAYDRAGRIIIDEYPDIADDSADILDENSTLENWNSIVIPYIKNNENIILSDITALDED